MSECRLKKAFLWPGNARALGWNRTIGVQDSGACDAGVRVPGEVRGGGEGTGIQQYRVGIEEADNVARFEHPHAGIRGGSETDVAFLLDDLDHWPAPPDRLGSPIARGVVHHHRRLEEPGRWHSMDSRQASSSSRHL